MIIKVLTKDSEIKYYHTNLRNVIGDINAMCSNGVIVGAYKDLDKSIARETIIPIKDIGCGKDENERM